jgi:adenylate cyclase
MLAKVTDQRDTAVPHDATVVFFDLIGSSAIGEKLSPVDFSRLLNTYFDTVTAIVGRHRGLVSGFLGDGIMAVFTESIPGQNHAALACRAALSAIRELAAVNAANARNALPPLRMRIGLNSGSVAEGEIGARDRFNFSVVGDVVNLAARLERLGKTLFPAEADVILVGSTTRSMCEHLDLIFIDCGVRSIEGRERPERVYRLIVN